MSASVAAILFVSADAFIIIEEVAAAIENEPLVVDLDGLGMMRRMAMNDRYIRPVDEGAAEALLLGGFAAPIRSPTKGDMARSPGCLMLTMCSATRRASASESRRQEVDTGISVVAAQSAGNAARHIAEGKDD